MTWRRHSCLPRRHSWRRPSRLKPTLQVSILLALAATLSAQTTQPRTLLDGILDQEKKLAQDPEDLQTRVNLIRSYTNMGRGNGSALSLDRIREARREHITWLIRHHPDNYALASSEYYIDPAAPPLADPAGFAEAAKLWKEQAANPGARVETIAHAAYFFSATDRKTALALLDPVWKKYPRDPVVARVRGTIDALEIMGIKGLNGWSDALRDEALARSAEAQRARAEVSSSENAALLMTAAQIVMQHVNLVHTGEAPADPSEMAEGWYKRAMEIEPTNASLASGLANIYQWRGGNRRDPAEKIRWLREGVRVATSEWQRPQMMAQLAEAELEGGQTEAAEKDARLLLETPLSRTAGAPAWDAVHKANTTLGLAAMQRGKVDQAKTYLLASARVKTTPVLGSFGPSMKLAQLLADAGEKEAVLQYLDMCREFWTNNNGRLDKFAKSVKEDGTPNLGLPAPARPPLPPGQKAPEFRLKDLDGKEWTLAELTGKVVALDFWATWCGPCRDEMPALSKVAKEMADKGAVVLGMDANEQEDVVRTWVAKNPLGFPAVLGDDKTIRSYEITAYPTMIVLDKNGKIAGTHIGGLRESEIHSAIDNGFAGAPELRKLATPEPLTPTVGAVFDHYPRTTTVTWKPVDGAIRYVVEWDFRHSDGWSSETPKGALARLDSRGTAATFSFVGAQPGRWRVTAIGSNGERGDPSAWRDFLYTK